MNNRGVTLISLVITVIILLVLSGVILSMLVGEKGIIKYAEKARDFQANAVASEEKILREYENIIDGGIKVTIGGKTVTLTEDNYADYLGRVVTNYKTKGTTETVTAKTANSETNEFIVSTTYRLYYIDFDNKYGDGAGTVYLKADCTSNGYILSLKKDTNHNTIKNLNSSLYTNGVTAPKSSNSNMKAVTWLLDTTEWSQLVTSGANTDIGSKVNYAVLAPSLEMMIDSFNAHYKLTEDTPDYSSRTSSSARTKLFYKYATGLDGYQVGPGNSVEYENSTSNYSVQTDSDIDTMYYPGNNNAYWLASPSAYNKDEVMCVSSGSGGRILNRRAYYGFYLAFCPLVSLQSDVQLSLE